MTGTVGILNVGAGDIKLSFDKNNPQERIRAARIVKDMLRRGFALLVEIERDGVKKYERALDFNEEACQYIIADYDPVTAEKADKAEEKNGGVTGPAAETSGTSDGTEAPPPRRKYRRRGVDAGAVKSIAVARSAGG